MRETYRVAANIISKEFFQVALIMYVLLTALEMLKEGSVSNFFNMHYLLVVVLVTGFVALLTESMESPVRQAAQQAGQAAVQTAANMVAAPLRPRAWLPDKVIDLRRFEPTGTPVAAQRRERAQRQLSAIKNRRQFG